MLKPEERTQKALVEYMFMVYPQVFPYVIKINNEGKRSAIGTYILKLMGLHPGASDLFIACPTRAHGGLWMEIKPDGWAGPKSKAEKEHVARQKRFLENMDVAGYGTAFCVGIDECMRAVDNYFAGTFKPRRDTE